MSNHPQANETRPQMAAAQGEEALDMGAPVVPQADDSRMIGDQALTASDAEDGGAPAQMGGERDLELPAEAVDAGPPSPMSTPG